MDDTNLKVVVLMLLLLYLSCSENQKSDKHNREIESRNMLYEKDYLREYINKNYTEKNIPFDGVVDRNPRVYYSISMYTDSLVTIMIKPNSIKDLNTNTLKKDLSLQGWENALNTVISTIEIADSNYINMSNYPGESSLTSLTIKTGSFKVFEELCKLKEVHSLDVSGGQFMLDIQTTPLILHKEED